MPSSNTTKTTPSLKPDKHHQAPSSFQATKNKNTQTPPNPHPPIRVTVTNRLGLRTEILCSPNDTIADFKKLVAFQIGVRAEAIEVKRQGQRPLRDFLTLRDYEIGCGSSLDLEVGTGEEE